MDGFCTGSGWRDENLFLELRGKEKELLPIRVGQEVAFRVDGRRSCIGYRPPDDLSLVPCPDENSGISSSQCPACFERAHILPCLRCDGERCRNPERRSSCVQPENHAVYLAAFGPGLHKVGVARWGRRRERVLEQGARAALIIARDDGQMVRRLEKMVSKTGIPDRIPPGQKISALTERGEPGQLAEELLSALAGIRHRVRGQWLRTPELLEIPEFPALPHRPLELQPEGLALRGQVRGVIGQHLIVSREADELVAVDATALHGYRLRPLSADEGSSGQAALLLVG